MFLEGQQIDRYRILRLIGGGGMGDVYLAEDPRIEQQVAIKVMRTELSPYPNAGSASQAIHLFQREAKAIAKLDHPHILPLFSYGEQRIGDMTVIYLVMPYRPEGSLAKWVSQRTQEKLLSPLDVAHFVWQASSALQHAHDRGIIHQDVKPSNFLIRERKETPERPDLLLADFGIARLMNTTSVASQSVHGTPTYMSPEQCLGHAVPASDQYALAIMVYELLTGHPPFRGASMQVMFQQIHALPQPPGSFNSHLSQEVDQVLLHALAKQAGERFASISAFSVAFEQAVQNLRPADRALSISTNLLNNAPVSSDLRAELAISEAEAQNGTTRVVTLPSGRTLRIQVPPGVQDGYVVRLDSQDHPFNGEGNTDIILLTIRIKQETETSPLAASLHAQSTALIPGANELVVTMDSDQSTFILPDSNPVQPPANATEPVSLSTTLKVPPEIASTITTANVPTATARSRPSLWLMLALVLLVVLVVSGSVIFVMADLHSTPSQTQSTFPPGISPATVTITPVSKNLENTYVITTVTTTPDPTMKQVAARLISSQTPQYTQTVPATGSSPIPATHASGTLTLYNYSTTSSVRLTAGTDLPNLQTTAVDMILDGNVTVPAATDPTNPPTGNVAAHVAQTGTIGNLPPVNNGNAGFYYCTNCSGGNVKGWEIENDSAFSGGHDAQTVTAVRQQDIDNAASSLETSNAPNPQQVLQSQVRANEQSIGTPQCKPNVSSNHPAGDAATSVTVTVTFTCTDEVYDKKGALSLAAKLLGNQAATDLGTSYALRGDVVTALTQAVITDATRGTITLNVTAQGVWVFQFNAAQKQKLAILIAGKTQQQAQALLLRQAGVQQVNILLPGGGSTLPADVHRISLVIHA
jgi:serine/threonine protein kinase